MHELPILQLKNINITNTQPQTTSKLIISDYKVAISLNNNTDRQPFMQLQNKLKHD